MKKLNTKGTLKQDLTAARAELKQFRHDVAILKKKGILQAKLYDARSVKPSRYLKQQIKQFGKLLSGESASVKISKSKTNYYLEKGYQVKNGRVIVPVIKGEKLYPTHGGFVSKIIGAGGSITKIDKMFNREDVSKWIDDLKNARLKLKDDEVLAFQFFGNNSHRAFEDLNDKTAAQAMAEYIENYPAFDYAEDDDPEGQQEFIDNVTVFRIKRDENGKVNRPPKNAFAKAVSDEQARINSQRNHERYLRRLNAMTPAEEDKFLARKAETEKKRRAQMRATSGDATQAYRDAAKARAKKSRENKKHGKKDSRH